MVELSLFTLSLLYLPLFCNYLAILCLCLPNRVISTPVGHIYPFYGYAPILCVEAMCQIFWSYCIFKNVDIKKYRFELVFI